MILEQLRISIWSPATGGSRRLGHGKGPVAPLPAVS
jgi:hypothetical protein